MAAQHAPPVHSVPFIKRRVSKEVFQDRKQYCTSQALYWTLHDPACIEATKLGEERRARSKKLACQAKQAAYGVSGLLLAGFLVLLLVKGPVPLTVPFRSSAGITSTSSSAPQPTSTEPTHNMTQRTVATNSSADTTTNLFHTAAPKTSDHSQDLQHQQPGNKSKAPDTSTLVADAEEHGVAQDQTDKPQTPHSRPPPQASETLEQEEGNGNLHQHLHTAIFARRPSVLCVDQFAAKPHSLSGIVELPGTAYPNCSLPDSALQTQHCVPSARAASKRAKAVQNLGGILVAFLLVIFLHDLPGTARALVQSLRQLLARGRMTPQPSSTAPACRPGPPAAPTTASGPAEHSPSPETSQCPEPAATPPAPASPERTPSPAPSSHSPHPAATPLDQLSIAEIISQLSGDLDDPNYLPSYPQSQPSAAMHVVCNELWEPNPLPPVQAPGEECA